MSVRQCCRRTGPTPLRLPAQPKVGLFHTNVPTAVANNMGQTSTKTGGFGDPMGVHPNPGANRPATSLLTAAFRAQSVTVPVPALPVAEKLAA